MNIRIAQPPLRIPQIDLKQHWDRKFHSDAKVKWLRGLVATLSPTSPTSGVTRDDRRARAGRLRHGAGNPEADCGSGRSYHRARNARIATDAALVMNLARPCSAPRFLYF